MDRQVINLRRYIHLRGTPQKPEPLARTMHRAIKQKTETVPGKDGNDLAITLQMADGTSGIEH
jgi:hypothetical protein